jgi:hypothetical protein
VRVCWCISSWIFSSRFICQGIGLFVRVFLFRMCSEPGYDWLRVRSGTAQDPLRMRSGFRPLGRMHQSRRDRGVCSPLSLRERGRERDLRAKLRLPSLSLFFHCRPLRAWFGRTLSHVYNCLLATASPVPMARAAKKRGILEDQSSPCRANWQALASAAGTGCQDDRAGRRRRRSAGPVPVGGSVWPLLRNAAQIPPLHRPRAGGRQRFDARR